MRKMRFAAMASALALSTPATAGFFDLTLAPFIGASMGQATSDVTCTGGILCDDSDLTWKLYGGMEINEYISMEIGYVDMGAVKYSGTKTGTREVNGTTMRMIGTYALNPSFTLMGSGGMNILLADVKGTIAGTKLTAEDVDVAWSVGLGAQYNITPSMGLRMEWQRFFEVGSSNFNGGTGEADIDLISAGLVFKF